MSTQQFSSRVLRALELIETRDFTRKEMRTFYENAMRDLTITEIEREAVIAALERRVRITAPRDAVAMFGPKDTEARSMLSEFHDKLAGELDLSKNMVRAGVKTGGEMIRGDAYVSVYISYKSADRRHVSLEYLQRSQDTDPTLLVRFYQTGTGATEPGLREEFSATDWELAQARYRQHLALLLVH